MSISTVFSKRMWKSEFYDDGEFSDKDDRMEFVRKVFAIIGLQLLITTGIAALIVLYEPVTQLMLENMLFVMIICMGGTSAIMIGLVCVESLRRTFPINLILLIIFTCFFSVTTGMVCLRYSITEILIALGITTFLCFCLIIFALQTKIDFTVLAVGMMIAVILLLVMGIVLIFFYSKFLYFLYSCAGALIFSIYLVVNVQLMLGGKHANSISPEDYILAAINIYVDLINIFIYMLAIVRYCMDRD